MSQRLPATARREQILDVALAVFASSGFHGASMNDIAEGGGTRFVYQDYVVRPGKGRTVLWPAGYTHVHCGQVAPHEDKYIITGWWSYDEPAETEQSTG